MAELMSGAVGSIQGSVQGIANTGWAWLDRVLPPERRANLIAKVNKFAAERPGVASFLLSHIALSGLPIAIFVIFTITVAIVALLVAIVVALLAAVLFIVVMAGFALAILFPILLFTTFVAVAVWFWCWGAYYLLKWFNQEEIPGIHTGLREGLMRGSKNDSDTNKDGADSKEQSKPKAPSNANGDDHGDTKKLVKRQPGHKNEASSRKVDETANNSISPRSAANAAASQTGAAPSKTS